MKVNWDTLTHPVWDAHHAAAAAPLQQDWAYGACMKTLGVGVLRAYVEQDGAPVALAQFIVRRWVGGLDEHGTVLVGSRCGCKRCRVLKRRVFTKRSSKPFL